MKYTPIAVDTHLTISYVLSDIQAALALTSTIYKASPRQFLVIRARLIIVATAISTVPRVSVKAHTDRANPVFSSYFRV